MLPPVVSSKLAVWSRIQALAWTPALVWCAFAAPVDGVRGCLAAGLGGSVLWLAWVLRSPRTLADAVTLLRALLVVAAVAAPWWLGDLPWWTWGLLLAAAALDLVDGFVARRFGSTANGAVLDMETDQLAVLALAWLVVARGGAPHVLLLPLMRYAFVLAAWVASLPANDPKPVDGDNARGRIVCAAVVVGLLLALLPTMPRNVADVLSGVAVLLLIWSFAGDWAFLFARKRREVRS